MGVIFRGNSLGVIIGILDVELELGGSNGLDFFSFLNYLRKVGL
jgi:hypothetical protein